MHGGVRGRGLAKLLVTATVILVLAGSASAAASQIALNTDAFADLGLHSGAIQNNQGFDDIQGRLGAYPFDDATIGGVNVNGAIVGRDRESRASLPSGCSANGHESHPDHSHHHGRADGVERHPCGRGEAEDRDSDGQSVIPLWPHNAAGLFGGLLSNGVSDGIVGSLNGLDISTGTGVSAAAITPVPEPATLLLLGLGLGFVAHLSRRRRSVGFRRS